MKFPGHILGRRVALLFCLFALAASVTPAAAQQRGGSGGRFQRPTEERRVQVGDEPGMRRTRRTRAAGPENMEDALYLRERADTLGEASLEFRSRLLARLLREREQLVDVRRDEAIRLLREFIGEEPEAAVEMADALLRLAELLWEQARVNYLHAFAAWQRVPTENRGPEPRPDYAEAMELYDRILTRHRNFDRYDLVLYMKAYALVERGDQAESLDLYRRILAEFPRSRFVPDGHMALAEAEFTGQYNYEAALAEYEQVLQYPDSGLYDVALFKSAWCLWRLNRTREAATRFRQVLDLGRNRGRLSAAQRRRLQDLQQEALDYLIQVFTDDETNTAQDIFRFLQEIGGERYAYRVLGRLSETYFGQARYERGIDAYKLLLEMDPVSPRAPEYQRAIAEGYGAMEDTSHTIEALTALATNYRRRSTWARAQGDAELIRRTIEMAERSVRRQALMWHEEGQRDNQDRKLENAATMYRVYLDSFRRAPAAYQVRFYMAEILFHRLERFAEAGDAYLATARSNPQGEFTRDALYNAIGAYEHVREDEMEHCTPGASGQSPRRNEPPRAAGAAEGESGGGPGGAGAAEGAVPAGATGEAAARPDQRGGPVVCGESDNDRKFSEAIELYVELFPNDPDLPEILFRQGRLYFDRRIYDPAVRLFGQLLERYPSSRFAEPAGELIIESFNRAQDYQNIERWARRLKATAAFQSAESQGRLDRLILQAMFKIGEQLAERGQHAAAADAYFRAAEEFPRDARARQAYYNSGVERQRAGDLSGAAAAYDRLIERYAGSSEGAQGCWAAAQMYESIAQFSDAARYYETYAERFPQNSRAADALYNAVLLRVTAGDNSAAVEDGNRFIQRFPSHQSVDETFFFVGRAHEASEDWADAASLYRRFLRQAHDLNLKVEATTRLAQVLVRAGNRREANRVLEDAVRLGRRNTGRLEGGLYYAAQARYMQGDQILSEYEAIRIEGDVNTLRDRLQRKAELLQQAALVFADVVEFHVAEWVSAALFQIGRSYELFAESLRSAPAPEGFNEEEQQSYQDQLAAFIIPMEERALEAYEGGYQKALELRIYNSWTERLRDGLTRLNDVQYPPFREMGGEIFEGNPLPMPVPLDGLRRGGAAEQPRRAPARPASPARGGDTPAGGES